MRFLPLLLALTLLPVAAPRASAGSDAVPGGRWTSARPDGHAPIGVMGDHTHHAGEWMLSYRFMRMDMKGLRDGTKELSRDDVFDRGYMVSPVRMTMEMHMFGAMFAPTDDLTLMAMAPYVRYSMDLVTRMGETFTTESDGIGDIRLSGLLVLHRWSRQQVHLNAGVGLPTGSITARDGTPAGPDRQLPYPMQPGSGTVDLLPGVTYLGQVDDWSWGGQATGTFRLGTNDRGYSLGNRGEATAWGARKLTRWLSGSLRLDGRTWGGVDGGDAALDPQMVPTANPHALGGRELDAALGVNLYGRGGAIRGHRLAAEVAVPIYRSLDGPQLETDWKLTVGWQYAR